jgi:hypothetical protein
MTEEPNVNQVTALAMWNAGKTLREIGNHFSISPWAARWAIERAEIAGYGAARRGRPKVEPPTPPMVEFWYGKK